MYFYITDTDSEEIRIYPGNTLTLVGLPKARLIIYYNEKHEKFSVVQDRYADITPVVFICLGIRVFSDGFFVSDKDKTLFLLKYQGVSEGSIVKPPLI